MQNKQQLVVCIMGQNCERFIGMCLESVKDADALYYLDGGSIDNTLDITQDFLHNHSNIKPSQIDIHKYNQEDIMMNGKQRNFYLKYLKENFKGYWCLVLDADEVVDDLSKIKEFIQRAPKDFLYSVKMRHFIGNLGLEDASQPEHFVPHRLFYVDEGLYYDEVEHPILKSKKEMKSLPIRNATIWHLAYLCDSWKIKEKYENHMKKSNIHTKDYLNNWKKAHLFGQYPVKPINLLEIPKVILKEFGVDWEELYFVNRGLEVKHFIDVSKYKNYYKL